MTEKDKVFQQQCLEHWDRMVVWVEKQPLDDVPSINEMTCGTSESWTGYHCSFCITYHNSQGCGDCPLYQKYGECDISKKNLWGRVNASKTWKTWLVWAKRFRKQIGGLK